MPHAVKLKKLRKRKKGRGEERKGKILSLSDRLSHEG